MFNNAMYFNSMFTNSYSKLGQSKHKKRCIICGKWFDGRKINGNKCPECVEEYKRECD